jgi:hypothetical protein
MHFSFVYTACAHLLVMQTCKNNISGTGMKQYDMEFYFTV